MQITNRALSSRGFNAVRPNGSLVAIELRSGEGIDDPDLEPAECPVFAGMISSGDLMLGEVHPDSLTRTSSQAQVATADILRTKSERLADEAA